MQKVIVTVLSIVVGLACLSGPAGAQTIQAELLLESFDGCNCVGDPNPVWEGDCPACDHLSDWAPECPDRYCNVHDGPTNCPWTDVCKRSDHKCLGPFSYPNWDGKGPFSIDDSWIMSGVNGDYGRSSVVSDVSTVDPFNDGSQTSILGPQALTAGSYFMLSYIDPNNQSCDVDSYWIHIEQLRQAYNAAHPDTPLPEPVANGPAYIVCDYKRAGADDMLLHASSVQFTNSELEPAGLTRTFAAKADRVIPADGAWHSITLVSFNGYPAGIKRYGVSIDINDKKAGTLSEDLQVWWDNLRLVYTGYPLIENCTNGVDDDQDGKTDCADTDCYFDPNCPCNPYLVFDTDNDGDVDQADFAFFQTCITGTNAPPEFWEALSESCKCMDVTGQSGEKDQFIDQQDLAVFEACASGPAMPANEACDD